MRVKPQMVLWLVLAAAALSYGIVYLILSQRDDGRVNIAENQADANVKPAYFRLPDASFYEPGGKKLTLADFQGKPVLVNLWATWCPPCVGELPSLEKLQAKMKPEGLVVVAISLDRGEDMTKITSFLDKNRIEHLHPYWDKDREVMERWEAENLPVTYFVSSDGTVRRKFEGPFVWDKPEMVRTLQEMMTK